MGLGKLRIETSTDSILSKADDDWAYYTHSRDLFGTDEIVVVAVEGSTPYDPRAIDIVAALTDQIESVGSVRRVDSVTTVPAIRSRPSGEVELDPAGSGEPPFDSARAAAVGERLDGDRIAAGTLASDDGRVFAVNVLMDDLGSDFDRMVVGGVRRIAAPYQAWVTGGPVFRTETNDRTLADLVVFVPVTVALVAGFLVLTFGTIRAVIAPLACGGVADVLLLGIMGAVGVPMTIATLILPSILFALACAYSMHLLVAATRRTTDEELPQVMASVAVPVALSGVTTAIGFASIAVVRIDAVWQVGLFGGIGVLLVSILTLTLGPAILTSAPLPISIPRGGTWLVQRHARWLTAIATRRSDRVLVLWASGIAVFVGGLGLLTVETDVVLWFPRGDPVRESYEEVKVRLSGISPMNVVIEAQADDSVLQPATLNAIGRLSEYLGKLPEVGKSLSVVDPLAQLHTGFGGEGSLPDSEAAAEQYLLILESVDQINDVITADRRAANIMLRVDNNGSNDLLNVAAAAESWWNEFGAPGFTARVTGIMYEYARAEDEIAFGQLRGLGLALGVVGLVLVFVFRRARLVTLAILPNVVPLLIVFGIMGFIGTPIDAGTVFLGSLAVGMAVDDTIHVVWGYERARRLLSAGEAVALSLERSIVAIAFTTVAVAAGFAVLTLSSFVFIEALGSLTATIMVLCYLADVTLLPALLVRFDSGAPRSY